jgi:hypothetical protein
MLPGETAALIVSRVTADDAARRDEVARKNARDHRFRHNAGPDERQAQFPRRRR